MNQGPQENEGSVESQGMKDIRVILVSLDLVELLDHKAHPDHQASLENQAQKERWELRAQQERKVREG